MKSFNGNQNRLYSTFIGYKSLAAPVALLIGTAANSLGQPAFKANVTVD